ncbi:MAG: hypothetical protein AB7I27_11075 [Bacteriovoracaceae bacterium]
MNKFIFLALLVQSYFAFANGGPYSSGTVLNDERNLKTFKHKHRTPSSESYRRKAENNPRNQGFPGSFEQLGGEDRAIQRMEERKRIINKK